MSGEDRVVAEALVPRDVTTVIWDWNGTLLADVDLAIEIMNELLNDFGLPLLDRPRYQALFDFPVRRYYDRLGFGPEHGTFEELATRYIAVYDQRVEDCPLHDEVAEVLEAFTGRRVRNCVLTAARQTSVEHLLKRYGLRAAIGDVLGHVDDYAESKEHLGARWMADSGVAPEHTILIGDTVHDFEVAQALGVRCVLVSHGHHSPERLAACGCPVVPSLAALR